jgi:hypothetical protein
MLGLCTWLETNDARVEAPLIPEVIPAGWVEISDVAAIGVITDVMEVKTIRLLFIVELIAWRTEVEGPRLPICRQRLAPQLRASRKARAAALAAVRFPGDDDSFVKQLSAHG